MVYKGKEVVGENTKRKRDGTDKAPRQLKRKNRGVIQFFDDAAYEVEEDEESDDSGFDDDFLEDEFKTPVNVKTEPGKAYHLPFVPKEEELSEEELEQMLAERYKPGSSFVTYAEDVSESKRSMEGNAVVPSSKDPTIWKVKCTVGRERHSTFCLMQKYVDLQNLGTKLQIISAFTLEHSKGFIYIEAERQFDVNEACKGICTIYTSRVAPVPNNEVFHLLSVRSKSNEVSVGTWARVKAGKYKGDLAQVVAVNDGRKKATVKLIPRIDLQAMAEKIGGGNASKKTATPAPRLIGSTELEEFRPLIQYRRDRDSGLNCEVLDGLMLRDGYLFKKVPIESLSFWGVMPSEEELLKFEPSKKEESDCQEWLTQLYGEEKKERVVKSHKGGGKGGGGKGDGGKGEGSSSSSMANSFEVHDLVFFGRKNFGVIVGTEKAEGFKILKEGTEGPIVVTIDLKQLKSASFDKRLTALDHRMKTISINDTVRVLEGPLQGRQGIVKQIYSGIIFLYDENEQENSGYMCCKSQICEKIKLFDDACKGKDGESGHLGFEDFSSSPKSPSPKKAWEPRENRNNFNREDKDGMFSVGQPLRIRVGPLKGYLCRVLAIRRSDVTVKLDSQQKILTVKSEHLAEVRAKSSAISLGDDAESVKPFDLLGTQDCSGGWMAGAGATAEGDGWGAGGLSTEKSSWPSFPSSSLSLQPESTENPFKSVDDGTSKDVGDAAWEIKATPNQNSSWGTAVSDKKPESNSEQGGGWTKTEDSLNKTTANAGFGSVASDSWGSAKISSGDQAGSSNDAASWGKKTDTHENEDGPLDSWGKGKDGGSNQPAWGKAVDTGTGEGTQTGSWGQMKKDGASATGWGNSSAPESQSGGWGKAEESSGNKQDRGSSWSKQGGGSSWTTQGGGWNKNGMENEDDTNQQKSWDRTKTFDGGRGSGARRDGGSNACFKCGESGHMARDCSQGGGGGGNACFKCGETGHMARDCSQGGGRGVGGGNACFKCGETGHMARDCSQGGGRGGGGGNSCFKCGETGHMARDCSQGGGRGGGGGNACFKCGETGHMARDCSQGGGRGGGGGNACFKCGESGHMARDCSQGGGRYGGGGGSSGGNACFKCGESGHMARDCNQGSGGGGNEGTSWGKSGGWASGTKATWSSSMSEPKNDTGGWGSAGGNPVPSETEGSDWKKTTGMDGGQTGSWGKTKKDEAAGWGSAGGNPAPSETEGSGRKKTSSTDAVITGSWGNMKKDEGAGWGKSAKPEEGGAGKGTLDNSWGKAEKCSKDDSAGSKATWSGSAAEPKNQTGGWGSAGGNSAQLEVDAIGWKKDGGQTESWGKMKKDEGSGWGKSIDPQERSTGKGTEGDSWGKAEEKWSSKDGSGGSRSAWSGSMAEPKNQTGEGDSAGGNSTPSESEASGWKTATSVDGGQTKSWGKMKQDEATGWGNSMDSQEKSTGKGTEGDSWGKAADKLGSRDGSSGKPVWNGSTSAPASQTGGWSSAGESSWKRQEGGSSWGQQGGGSSWSNQAGSWNKNAMEIDDDTSQPKSWDGGRGSGGRRGGGSQGGTNSCFKCREAGHMARDCPQGGGGNACYKCGEAGHMARDCSQGGGRGSGGGGNACFKCGEAGHMARDCSQGGGSGGGRFGGGGGGCYNCGEQGHFARECPKS